MPHARPLSSSSVVAAFPRRIWLGLVVGVVLGCSSDPLLPGAAEPLDGSAGDTQLLDAASGDLGGKTDGGKGPQAKDIVQLDGPQFPDLPVNSSPTAAWLTPQEAAQIPANLAFICTATVSDNQTPAADLGYVLEITDPPPQPPTFLGVTGNAVSFAVAGLAPGPHVLTLTVTDGAGGAAVVARSVVATVMPAAPLVAISPEKPNTLSDLTAAVTPPTAAANAGGWSGSGELTYQWFRDNLPEGWATYASVPASQTARGEIWRVEVKAWVDGQYSAVGQASVTIINAPPGAVGLAFDATPPNVGSVALCAVHTPASDPDGDDVTYSYAWTLQDQPIAGATDWALALASLKDGQFKALVAAQVGQQLACVVTAHDGQGGEQATALSVALGANPACATSANPCDVAASCTPTDTAALTCTCNKGYAGDGQTCSDVDECADGTAGCAATATCKNVLGGAECACKPGFAGDGKNCSDIDECAADTAPCALSADCSNTTGGFGCACKAGFAGNGFACVNIDECKAGTDTCAAEALCTDSVGSYVCECPSGYDGNGQTCTDIDECADAKLASCSALATCSNVSGGYLCKCKDGYGGDGATCEDIDECLVSPEVCPASADCANMTGSYLCSCKAGYLGDGLTCLNIDECAAGTATCSSLASCTDTDGSFSCTCLPGYAGDGKTCTAP